MLVVVWGRLVVVWRWLLLIKARALVVHGRLLLPAAAKVLIEQEPRDRDGGDNRHGIFAPR
ncbi:MAG TPA: hypothetical protein PKY87_08285, partial [Terricaulis sp.]|nr:hypothetical protein [Terricaulis sp.]